MEFRWLVRTAFTPSPLLQAASFLPSVSTCAIRAFPNTSRLSTTPPPLPTTTTTTLPPPLPIVKETTGSPPPSPSPSPSKPSADISMAELFNMVAKSGPGPRHRSFGSILPNDFTQSNLNSPPLGAKAVPRTGPAAGRSVAVTNSDLPLALSRLRLVLTANSVKADQLRQRFHERPGLKKKRLKSARYRKRFKAGFKKLVVLAMDMKRKGL